MKKIITNLWLCCFIAHCLASCTPEQTQMEAKNHPTLLGTNSGYDFLPDSQLYRFHGTTGEELIKLLRPLEGDFVLDVNITQANATATMGLLLSLDEEGEATVASLQVTDGKIAFAPAARVNLRNAIPSEVSMLRLEKSGNQLLAYFSKPNEALRMIARQQLSANKLLYGGIFAHSVPEESVTFSNLRLSHPLKSNKQTNIKSRLEVIEIHSGNRKILHEEEGFLTTPCWSPDGQAILMTLDEKLVSWNISATKLEPIQLPNDLRATAFHGFSPKGDSLFTSLKDVVGTRIYAKPMSSEAPFDLMTTKSPSYFAAVHPDEGNILYLGKRPKHRKQLYETHPTKKVEKRLSRTLAFDESACVAADGNKLYLSAKFGEDTKLWQTSTTGGGRKQLTFDDYDDLYPQASPDGRYIVFLSQEKGQNDFDTFLLLRLLNLKNQSTKVLTTFHGHPNSLGTGAWSPDGKYVAFISYSAGQ